MRSPRSRATSFSMESWSPWIRKGDLPFSFCKTTCLGALPIYFYAFDLLNRNGELFVNLPIERAPRDCWRACLPRPRIRCACRRYCRRHRDKFLRRCASSVWKVSWANGSIPSTNPASDQAPGSSSARTWSRSSSSAVTSPERAGSMRCSWAFTRTKSSSSSRR